MAKALLIGACVGLGVFTAIYALVHAAIDSADEIGAFYAIGAIVVSVLAMVLTTVSVRRGET